MFGLELMLGLIKINWQSRKYTTVQYYASIFSIFLALSLYSFRFSNGTAK